EVGPPRGPVHLQRGHVRAARVQRRGSLDADRTPAGARSPAGRRGARLPPVAAPPPGPPPRAPGPPRRRPAAPPPPRPPGRRPAGWTVAGWMPAATPGDSRLDGQSPIQALRTGKAEQVLELAPLVLSPTEGPPPVPERLRRTLGQLGSGLVLPPDSLLRLLDD